MAGVVILRPMTIQLLSAVVALPLLLAAAVQALRAPRAALAVYAFVVPFGSALGVPGLGEFGTLSTVVGAMAGITLSVAVLIGAERSHGLDRAVPVWWLLVGVAAITVSWSISAATSVRHATILSALVALFSLAAMVTWTATDRRRLEIGIMAGGVVVALYGVGLAATGALALDDKLRFRLAGGGGAGEADANVTAAALLLPFAVALGDLSRDARRGVRVAAGVAAALLAVTVVLTGSRGGLLSLGVVAIVLWMHGPGRRVLGVAILVAVIAAALGGLAIATEETSERISERSLSGRSDIWTIGIRECLDVCLLGAGGGTFPYVHERGLLRQPDVTARVHRFQGHNVPLQTAVELGVFGLGLLVTALVLTAGNIRRLPRELRGPPLAAFSGVLVANLFLSNFDFKYFWLMLTYVLVVTIEARAGTPAFDRTTLESVR